jgi:hypothetical protein
MYFFVQSREALTPISDRMSALLAVSSGFQAKVSLLTRRFRRLFPYIQKITKWQTACNIGLQ